MGEDLPTSLALWDATAVWVIAAGLPAVGLHYFLGVSIGFSIVLGIVVAGSLFIGWIFLSDRALLGG